MWLSKNNFGNRSQGNFSVLGTLPSNIEGKILTIQQTLGKYFLEYVGIVQPIEVQPADSEAKYLIEEWLTYPERSIGWVEMVNKHNLLISLALFPIQISFDRERPLEIVITPAIDRDLRREQIPVDTDLLKFFNRHFLQDGFAIVITNKQLSSFSLIGDQWTCDISLSVFNIYETQRLIKKRRSVDQPVTLLRGNISFINEQQTSEVLKKVAHSTFMNLIKQNGVNYLERWEVYNDLELESRRLEIKEIGTLMYDSYHYKSSESGDGSYIFGISAPVPRAFYQTNGGFEATADEPQYTPEGEFIPPASSVYVGQRAVKSSDSHRLEIECEPGQNFNQLPPRGFLTGAFNGSKAMLSRRREAVEKVKMQKTKLPTLSLLLQTGDSPGYSVRVVKKTLSSATSKRVLGDKGKQFTEQQIKAIDIALRSPDIAIIQGPPGTGKTSVIRAIVSRIQELDAEAKVLISSTQHTAVDNAIEGLFSGGLPIHRLGNRRNKAEIEQNANWWNWVEQLIETCKSTMISYGTTSSRKLLRDLRFHMDMCLRNRSELPSLMEHLTEMYGKVVSLGHRSLSERIADFILLVKKKVEENQGELVSLIDKSNEIESSNDRLRTLTAAQRFDLASFRDDGNLQARRLVSYIKRFNKELSIPAEVETAAEWPEGEDKSLEEFLQQYQLAVESWSNESGFGIAPKAYQKPAFNVEESMNALFVDIDNELATSMKNKEPEIPDILDAFIEELDDPRQIDQIIQRYTRVSAATCQQSVAKRYSSEQSYDYVIIDEAARSNPLDLLIPMGLGKKIILVGDHKQLPHMLEKEVVDSYLKKHKDPELKEFLKKTLFEHLFNQFLETQNKPNGTSRVVTLIDQFRMHPVIGNFVSCNFYNGKLQSPVSEESKSHQLGLYQNQPIAWIDLPNTHGEEFTNGTYSRCRSVEIKHLLLEVRSLLALNEDYSIGIITFYSMQASRIQAAVDEFPMDWKNRIFVGSVDAFQGREFDVVYLSTVRSNRNVGVHQRVGFLDSENRLCVAFSRAKRLLVIIGDADTVAGTKEVPAVRQLLAFRELCVSEGYYEKR